MNKSVFETRAELIGYGRHGVIDVTIRRQNGTTFTFAATLLESAFECAKLNADLYYKSIGTSRYKEQKKKKRISLILNTKAWQQQVDDSVNFLTMVDADSCQYCKVAVRRVEKIEPVKFVR